MNFETAQNIKLFAISIVFWGVFKAGTQRNA
jgi:hypothetical protein